MSNISMHLIKIVLGGLLAILCLGVFAQAQQKNSVSGQKLSADELREKRLQWFRDARFGMMIHWGFIRFRRAMER